VRELGVEVSTRLTIVRAGGVVAADSEEEPLRMENHGTRPEILAARDAGTGSAVRWSHTLGVDMMYVAVAIRRSGRLLGYARAALPLTAVRDRLAHVRNLVILGVVLATAGGLVLGFFFARSVTRPLTELTEAAEAIAAGGLDREIRTDAPAEIGQLAAAFKRMTGRLEERMDAVSRGRSQLAAILSGMVEGVVAVDREGRVLHMNEVAGAMLGASPEASQGKPLWEATRIPAVLDLLKLPPEDAAVSTREMRLPDGLKERVLEVRASPLRDTRGGPGGLVIVLHDITDLRRLETVRRDFVANVSHELKTPVTAIRGLAETLIDDPGMERETHRGFLTKVRDQAERLSRLVGDLLALSRVESGGAALEREILDLRDPVRDSVRALEPAAAAKGLGFEAVIPPESLAVRGDREALRQVADNLLDNAVKYTPAGGRVRVVLRREAGEAVLEVHDSGPGIAPEHLGRIFERFYRVDKARSRELGGTGLGLSIVRHVALAHGGQAAVESTVGQGSTFRVRLPIVPA
jgi:two-component system phosphate regulon sensor histidine kinase PhoR